MDIRTSYVKNQQSISMNPYIDFDGGTSGVFKHFELWILYPQQIWFGFRYVFF